MGSAAKFQRPKFPLPAKSFGALRAVTYGYYGSFNWMKKAINEHKIPSECRILPNWTKRKRVQSVFIIFQKKKKILLKWENVRVSYIGIDSQ